ncbi:type II toxin-antitoxin system RelB/DinJ family antitoxin [Lacticaseibacillus mingshuiensis]|uniref:Type II toxin-antitoxin system RelB/DinJ family antitoxin n=1 Tax=Lacticaseibacillus mingshuiensis TaxID=2799574 RepID=A0ABW4CEN4_9LACO|nr:type II toxin-antitoxin system RelB/DinJ family antitoxin [Lacticaseibacillus mingshuiensis]
MANDKKATHLTVRIDPELKKAATAVVNELGMDLNTAITIFLTQMVRDRGLPFTPTTLPIETRLALREADLSERLRTYRTTDEMWRDLDD